MIDLSVVFAQAIMLIMISVIIRGMVYLLKFIVRISRS